jgi:hypothetical protein
MLRQWQYGAVALLMTLASLTPAQAQVGVITIKSVDDLMSDTQYVLTLAGQEDRAKQLEGLFGALTNGKRLQGVDTKKPLGIYVAEFKDDGGQPPPVVIFVPITKEEDFLEVLKQANVEPSKPDKGIYSLDTPVGQTIYMKFENKHAYAAMEADLLKDKLPDPAKFLPEVNRKNLIAVTSRIDQLPSDQKKKAIEAFDEQLAKEKEKKENETDEQYKLRMDVTNAIRNALVLFIEEGQNLTLSFNVDRSGGSLALDLSVTAKPGSQLATRIKDFGPAGVTAPVHFELSVGKLAMLFMPEDNEKSAALKKLFSGAEAGKDKVKLTLAGGEALQLKLEVSSGVVKLAASLAPQDGAN